MMRVLLILLALVVAVLAFVLDEVWLYWLASGLVVAAGVALGVYAWRSYREAKRFQGADAGASSREKELEDLGIMDVRPQSEKEKGARGDASSKASSRTTDEGAAAEASEGGPDREAEGSSAASQSPAGEDPSSVKGKTAAQVVASSQEEESAEESTDEGLVPPYLQALRAATDAHTVALLVQEEMALEYQIEGIASQSQQVRRDAFTTTEPLLSASMSREPVTVCRVGDDVAPDDLGYYTEGPPDGVDSLALAPVEGPPDAATRFLIVDASTGTTNLASQRTQSIITRFADLLGFIRESEASPEEAPDEEEIADAWDEVGAGVDGAKGEAPRPRREIIAEEIERAEEGTQHLALALVHLNRAEALARNGQSVVAQAEETLHARLDRLASDCRVERFGELTYGIFYHGNPEGVEPWAESLHEEMGRATGVLEGGVSIGVALRHERQQPEDLRENATEALRVAYETGTCTIVE